MIWPPIHSRIHILTKHIPNDIRQFCRYLVKLYRVQIAYGQHGVTRTQPLSFHGRFWFFAVSKRAEIPSNWLWIPAFELPKYKNLIQLLFWSNHLVNGSLKIEVCQIEIENTSSEILVLEYQDWFQKPRSDTDDLVSTWVRQVGMPRGIPLNNGPNYLFIFIVMKSIKAYTGSSRSSTKWKFDPGSVLNWNSVLWFEENDDSKPSWVKNSRLIRKPF